MAMRRFEGNFFRSPETGMAVIIGCGANVGEAISFKNFPQQILANLRNGNWCVCQLSEDSPVTASCLSVVGLCLSSEEERLPAHRVGSAEDVVRDLLFAVSAHGKFISCADSAAFFFAGVLDGDTLSRRVFSVNSVSGSPWSFGLGSFCDIFFSPGEPKIALAFSSDKKMAAILEIAETSKAARDVTVFSAQAFCFPLFCDDVRHPKAVLV